MPKFKFKLDSPGSTNAEQQPQRPNVILAQRHQACAIIVLGRLHRLKKEGNRGRIDAAETMPIRWLVNQEECSGPELDLRRRTEP